ncbi:MAG: hypothetical protein GEU93_11115 [Propionibacteriales bacterium]|nr:hypothetical protein [Propionibacteriales bacterium]
MRRLCVLLAIPAFLLSACGGDDSEGGGSASASVINGVTVTGERDEAPKLKLDEGLKIKETATEVLEEGDGPELKAGETILVHMVALQADNQESLINTYEGDGPIAFALDQQRLMQVGFPPGIADILEGRHTGDRVLTAMTPKDLMAGQSSQGAPALVAVFDIERSQDSEPLDGVSGDAADLPAGLPQLQLNNEDVPTGFDAAGAGKAPKELGVHAVIEGDGDEIESGDLVTVNYLGQIYPDGNIFDQSYERGEPTTFQLREGALIPGWVKGLEGMKKGSRVVLVIPPADGYGKQGNPNAKIKGTDTLVFVIDILGIG